MRPAIVLLGWPRIVGRENLQDVSGPVLVVCNHIDDADVGFVQMALPARLRHWLATATGGEALEALRTPKPDRVFFARSYDRLKWGVGGCLVNLFPLPRATAFLKSLRMPESVSTADTASSYFRKDTTPRTARCDLFRAELGCWSTRLGCSQLFPMRIDGLLRGETCGPTNRRVAGDLCANRHSRCVIRRQKIRSTSPLTWNEE